MPDTATQTLAEFLLARIAEDEEISRKGEQWADTHTEAEMHSRVLAECEAKRRIVDEHPPYVNPYGEHCATCNHDPDAYESWPCPTMLALAQPYADHEAFRQEWRADA